MATFNDLSGRAWSVSITIGVARKLKADGSVDLMDGGQLGAAIQDPFTRFDLLWAACQAQAKTYGIETPDEFEQQLVPATASADDTTRVWTAAQHALTDALIDFFHRTGATDLARVMQKAMETATKIREASLKRLDGPQMEHAIAKAVSQADKAMDQAMEKAMAELEKLGTVSGS